MQISVVQPGADKLTQREQIEMVLERAREKHEPLRVRLPFTLYDYDPNSRGYVFVRDGTWNLQLPIDQTSAEGVEELIRTLGTCIVAIARLGNGEVVRRLEEPTETPAVGTLVTPLPDPTLPTDFPDVVDRA